MNNICRVHQIRQDVQVHVHWTISLVITDGLCYLPQQFMYVWVKIHLPSLRVEYDLGSSMGGGTQYNGWGYTVQLESILTEDNIPIFCILSTALFY